MTTALEPETSMSPNAAFNLNGAANAASAEPSCLAQEWKTTTIMYLIGGVRLTCVASEKRQTVSHSPQEFESSGGAHAEGIDRPGPDNFLKDFPPTHVPLREAEQLPYDEII